MHKRATSIKRAAEAEKEISMEDTEATPVKDVEMLLPPAEPNKSTQQKEQHEKLTQTGDKDLQETMMRILIGIQEDNTKTSKKIEEKSKKMEEKMEENSKKMEETLSKKMEEKKNELKNDNKSTREELKQINTENLK